MKFPLVLTDVGTDRELLRINPDASITVLDWDSIETWARSEVCAETGVLTAFCRVISAARDNFVETTKDESDRMGRSYSGPAGRIGARGERFISGRVYGLTADYVWQVNWPVIEIMRHEKRVDTGQSAVALGLSKLFIAAKDNFITVSFE